MGDGEGTLEERFVTSEKETPSVRGVALVVAHFLVMITDPY